MQQTGQLPPRHVRGRRCVQSGLHSNSSRYSPSGQSSSESIKPLSRQVCCFYWTLSTSEVSPRRTWCGRRVTSVPSRCRPTCPGPRWPPCAPSTCSWCSVSPLPCPPIQPLPTGLAGIITGLHYRLAAWTYALAYWYMLLLERSRWNNHSYLFGLLALMLATNHSHRKWSLDVCWRGMATSHQVPRYQYFVLRFQIFLVYFYAGLKKTNPDWLRGYSMVNLSGHWIFQTITYSPSSIPPRLTLIARTGRGFPKSGSTTGSSTSGDFSSTPVWDSCCSTREPSGWDSFCAPSST